MKCPICESVIESYVQGATAEDDRRAVHSLVCPVCGFTLSGMGDGLWLADMARVMGRAIRAWSRYQAKQKEPKHDPH